MHTTLLKRSHLRCALVIAVSAVGIGRPMVGLAEPAGAKPVDLLKLIDPKRDAVAGDWKFDGGALLVPKGNGVRLQVPYTPPAGYRLEMIVERKEGRDGLIVGLIVGGRQAVAAIDCWNGRSGLGQIDGKGSHDNESTVRRRVIPDGKPCTLVFVVQPDGVEATCDGRRVFSWHGDVARLSLSNDWVVQNRNGFFLADNQVSMRISKMELIPFVGQNTAPAAAPVPQIGQASTQQIVERVEPSLVVVEVALEKGTSQGSGFLLDKQGTFVTNYHVIEGAKSVEVKFRDKSTAAVPGYLAILPGKDLAILRCQPGARKLEPLPLAATQPAKGEAVLTFGAPLGFGATVSDGIVSAIRSGSDVSEILNGKSDNDVYSNSLGYDLDATWLQVTAPISPGNSGGPLVNMRGEVLGLNTWSLRSGQNLNFAISAQHIKTLLTSASANHPFAELPKPREGREVAALGDA
ncbi:MAG: S1C family serine protease, partial [Pirellulales bacterium]